MINYTWIAERLDAYPEKDGFNDVVFVVFWRCNAVDGDKVATLAGKQAVTLDPDGAFTPYADLQQWQVLNWVKDALTPKGVADIENNLAGMIATQIKPPASSPALPWGK
jgi:hypothetical protein